MDTTLPAEELPAAGVEANPQPASKVSVKPEQDCGMPLPVRGAAAAGIACDECLAVAIDEVSNEAITNSVKIAGAHIKAAISKPKPHRARPSGKLKHWGQMFEICTSPESNLGRLLTNIKASNSFRVTKASNFGDPDIVAALKDPAPSRLLSPWYPSMYCVVNSAKYGHRPVWKKSTSSSWRHAVPRVLCPLSTSLPVLRLLSLRGVRSVLNGQRIA